MSNEEELETEEEREAAEADGSANEITFDDADVFSDLYNTPRKTCTKCGEAKPVIEFSWAKKSIGRRSARCKECNGDENVTRNRATRVTVLQYYSGGEPKCACCGEKSIEFLGIDHIYGGGSAHRAEIRGMLWSWLKRNNFPDGFRVLCHNCNQALGAYGYCPHQTPNSIVWDAYNIYDFNAPNKSYKLTPEQVVSIRLAIQNGATQKSQAEQYGVSRALICLLYGRKRWNAA